MADASKPRLERWIKRVSINENDEYWWWFGIKFVPCIIALGACLLIAGT